MKSLKNYNTYRIDTSADNIYEVKSLDELINLLDELNQTKTKYYILGGGSNVILPSTHFSGAIIRIKIDYLEIKNDKAYVGAGLSLNAFIKAITDAGYPNLINLYGIPGTVGGAIHGNAGANGMDIFTYLDSVTIYQNKSINTLKVRDIKHGYRFADFQDSDIIVGATFNLVQGNPEEAWLLAQENMEKRKNTQPLEYPNAGSVFKNPEGLSAGKLIDECGLKGLKQGGAMVSEKHANFIINYARATSSDIIELIEVIKEKVKKEKGIELELEQKIVKW